MEESVAEKEASGVADDVGANFFVFCLESSFLS